MPREKHCPKCGDDITETYIEDDPDCGITGGYVCEKCDEGYPIEHDEEDYRDE